MSTDPLRSPNYEFRRVNTPAALEEHPHDATAALLERTLHILCALDCQLIDLQYDIALLYAYLVGNSSTGLVDEGAAISANATLGSNRGRDSNQLDLAQNLHLWSADIREVGNGCRRGKLAPPALYYQRN